jgi:hypothetical protein
MSTSIANSLSDFSRDLVLNPVIVHQEGAGVSLIDARVRLSE